MNRAIAADSEAATAARAAKRLAVLTKFMHRVMPTQKVRQYHSKEKRTHHTTAAIRRFSKAAYFCSPSSSKIWQPSPNVLSNLSILSKEQPTSVERRVPKIMGTSGKSKCSLIRSITSREVCPRPVRILKVLFELGDESTRVSKREISSM